MAKAGPFISIGKRDVPKFLAYIGPTPVQCYAYKWRLPTDTRVIKRGGLVTLSTTDREALDVWWAEKYHVSLEDMQAWRVNPPALQRAIQEADHVRAD